MDAARNRADSAFKYSLYFDLLQRKINKYNIESQNIHNINKKGFLIGVLSKMKRIFSRRLYEEGAVKQII